MKKKGFDNMFIKRPVDIEDEITYFYVHDNVVVGEFVLCNYYTQAHIINLKIYEEYRNQGFGTKMLLEAFEDIFNNFSEITLDCYPSNTIGQKLYDKVGMTKIYDKSYERYHYTIKKERV